MNHLLLTVLAMGVLIITSRTLQALPRTARPSVPEDQLAIWRFNEVNPNAGNLIRSVNLEIVESWSGFALRMAGPETRLFALPDVSASGQRNLDPEMGTVRFWFAPEWSGVNVGGDGPGAESTLLERGAWSPSSAQASWSVRINSEGTSLSLVVRDGANAVRLGQIPLTWQLGIWHQFAISWSGGGWQIHVDATLVAQGATQLPRASLNGRAGFCLGSDVQGNHSAQGQFEELQTFDYISDHTQLAADLERLQPLSALGPVSPAEEQATLAAFAEAAFHRQPPVSPSLVLAAQYTGLHLELEPNGSSAVTVRLHNTIPGTLYQILTAENIQAVPEITWVVEQTVEAAAGQDWSETTVATEGRSALFLQARCCECDESASQGFAGLTQWDAGSFPPDTMGAVGPAHFVELLNGVDAPAPLTSVAVYSKSDGTLEEGAEANLFFEVPEMTLDIFDIRILYDHDPHGGDGNRWIACAVDKNSRNVILAVSKDSSPLSLASNWTKYVVPVAKTTTGIDLFTDYVTLGIDENGIYLSVWHLESGAQEPHRGHTIVAIDKDKLYDPTTPTLSYFPFDITAAQAPDKAIVPAVNFDTIGPGGYAWFLTKSAPTDTPSYKPGQITYIRLQWDGDEATRVDAEPQQLPASEPTYLDYLDLSNSDVIAPSLGAAGIETVRPGSRIQTAVIRGGYLWTGQMVGLDGNDGDYDGNGESSCVDRTGAQWIKMKINNTGESLTYSDHGRFFDAAPNPLYYVYPSLMVNELGDIVAGFSGCNESNYVGAFFSWRRADGTTSCGPLLIHAGESPLDRTEIGDYSSTTLDPEDSRTFWTVQEYAGTASGTPIWATWIAKIAPGFPP